MSEEQLPARQFALAPLDRNGVMLGLSWSEVAFVALGASLTSFLMLSGAGFVFSAIPVALAWGFTKARFRGLPLIDWFRPLLRLVGMRKNKREWSTTQPWFGTEGEVPEVLTGLKITTERFAGGSEWGVLWDNPSGEAVSMLRVTGTDFALLHSDEQVGLLDGWGNALAQHATEGSPVVRICWTEIANRTSLEHHIGWAKGRGQQVHAGRHKDYMKMVIDIGPETTRHDVIVAIVVSRKHMSASKWGVSGKNEVERAVEALRRATHQVISGLNSADLTVNRPMDVAEIGSVMRHCIDPTGAMSIAPRVGSMSARLGLVDQGRFGPYETRWENEWFETDKCLHRSYMVADWPRHGVNGDWFTRLLAKPEHSRRLTVVFEPTAPSVSHRRIERELTKLETDAMVREEKGRRVTAGLRRSVAAVSEREEELVSGFAETEYVGLITISAPNLVELEESSRHFEGSAAEAGLTLRPLDFQHDLGWAASLPIGLGIAPKGALQ